MKLEDLFCPCCGVLQMEDESLFYKLATLEARWDSWSRYMPLVLKITSGYRCEKHNAEVGGSPDSQHLKGRAVDIARADGKPLTDEQACTLKEIAIDVGFRGICPYPHHVHVDTRKGMVWVGNKR